MWIIEKLKDWYRGEYVPPPPNDPNDDVVLISPGYYEQPLLARFLGILGRFWLAHWQWLIGTAIAIAAVLAAIWKH